MHTHKSHTQKKEINEAYPYEGNDIHEILSCRLQKLIQEFPNLFLKPIHILAAIDDIPENQLEKQLQTEKNLYQGERTIIIPFNLKAQHWVGILIEFKSNGKIERAQYIDTIRKKTNGIEHLQKQITNVYNDCILQTIVLLTENDYNNCALIVVENLLMAALNEKTQIMSAKEIRHLHLKSLKKFNFEFYQNFYSRQRDNQPTTKKLHEKLFNTVTTVCFSKQQIHRVLNIILCISEIQDNKIRALLWNTFEPQKYKTEHTLYLNKIQKKLKESASYLSKHEKSGDQKLFQALIQLLFRIKWKIGSPLNIDNAKFKLKYIEILAITQNNINMEKINIIQKKLEREINEEISKIFIFPKTQTQVENQELQVATTLSKRNAFKKITGVSLSIILPSGIIFCKEFVESIFISNMGTDHLSAAGFISPVRSFVILSSLNALTALETLVSEAYGAKKIEEMDPIFKKGLLFALALSIPSIGIVVTHDILLDALGIPKETTSLVQSYFYSYALSIPADLMFDTQMQFAFSVQKGYYPIIGLLALNTGSTIGLGYVLGYGKLGSHKLDIAGFGYANSIISWLSFIAFTIYFNFSATFKEFSLKPFSFKNVLGHFSILKKLLTIGLPSALQIGTETFTLIVTTTLIEKLFGIKALAAHQIATQYFIISTIPYYFGINEATNILTAEAVGEGNPYNAKLLGNTSIVSGVGVSIINLIILTAGSKPLISLFIDVDNHDNSEVVETAQLLLIAVAVGQIFDSIRLDTAGALQGSFRDTTFSLITTILTLSLMATLLGYVLGVPAGIGVLGMYIARNIGALSSSIALLGRWYNQTKTIPSNHLVFREEYIEKTPPPIIFSQIKPKIEMMNLEDTVRLDPILLISEESKKSPPPIIFSQENSKIEVVELKNTVVGKKNRKPSYIFQLN